MANLEFLSTLLFFVLICIWLLKERKKVQLKYGLIIKKWKGATELIDKIAKKKKLLRIIGSISIITGLFASFFGFYLLVNSLVSLQRTIAIVLPTVGRFRYPGPVVSVPFWYWFVVIFITIAAHESMHAVYSRMEKIPIKDYGIILFLCIPLGAFVDPDTKKIKKLNFLSKLRIYAAGPFANLTIAALSLIITIGCGNLVSLLIAPSGVSFSSTIPNTPAHEVNLTGIILRIDNKTITNVMALHEFLLETKPGTKIEIFTTEGKFDVVTVPNPEDENISFLGISNVTNVFRYKALFTGYVPEKVVHAIAAWFRLLYWMFLLNLGFGVANMLPLKPLDGQLIYEELLTRKFGKNGKKVANVLSGVTLLLILFNLLGIPIIKLLV